MNNLIRERVNNTKITDETCSLTGQELADVDSTGSRQSTLVTSKKTDWRIGAVNDQFSKQRELLRKLMKKTPTTLLRRYKETSGLIQGSSRAPNLKFDIWIFFKNFFVLLSKQKVLV